MADLAGDFIRGSVSCRYFVCLCCAFGILAGSPATPSAHATGESKGKRIAFLQTLATHPYVAATAKSFRARAEALGMEITFSTSMLDAALQAQQIDDAIARKFDLVVVVPTSEQAVVPATAPRSRRDRTGKYDSRACWLGSNPELPARAMSRR
jgi:ABC-type sugar transport system substrate-binding protein